MVYGLWSEEIVNGESLEKMLNVKCGLAPCWISRWADCIRRFEGLGYDYA